MVQFSVVCSGMIMSSSTLMSKTKQEKSGSHIRQYLYRICQDRKAVEAAARELKKRVREEEMSAIR